MPQAREPEPATGPDLSGLRIDEQERRGRRRPWWGLLALATLLALAGAGYWLYGRAPVVEVAVVRVAPAGRPPVLNASGYVTPRRRATIAAKITGLVKEIFAEEGMRVQAGQVLATLDDSDARARLLAAKAEQSATAATLADLRVNLANAERDRRRFEELWRDGAVSEESVDRARTAAESLRARIALANEQVRAAEAQTKVAEQDLENTVIRAPFAGLVVSRDAQRGEMVSPISAGGGFTRTGIATIVDMTSLEVEVDVNESSLARITPDQPVQAVLDAYSDWKIPARVRTVIPTADRQKATVKVRVAFDSLDPRILPDMGVKVTFLGPEPPADQARIPRAIVPKAAIREEGGDHVVYVLRDNRVARRIVRLGQARGNEQDVNGELADGEQVVVNGPDGLKDGQRVRKKG